MALMMSPRSPSSRITGSAFGDTIHLPVSISVASPIRSSLRARSIRRAILTEGVAHVLVGTQVGKLPPLLLGDQHPGEPREAIGIHLPLKLLRHLELALPAQFPGNDL